LKRIIDSDDDTPGDDDICDDNSGDGDRGDANENKKSVFANLSIPLLIVIIAVIFILAFVLIALFVRLKRIRKYNTRDDELGYDEEKPLEDVYSGKNEVPNLKTEAVTDNELIEELEELFNDYLVDDEVSLSEDMDLPIPGKNNMALTKKKLSPSNPISESRAESKVSGQLEINEKRIIMKPLKRTEKSKPVTRKQGMGKLDLDIMKIFEDE
jgi:hypothetical protein